ncbi:PREDICTED: F-box protein At2g16300-like [Camelina sativa]|uniref:F-box protein At2g16300-like n=1 Tax=Camelina sativa TaxID=90675 RepID=A0ABM1RBY6_CAMSA|nr:PREDICTED: F-box protein At2g16300-like [Camelina sativa]
MNLTIADWSLLPKDILELISGRFETCFEIIHIRSVCSSWWSALPQQSYLSRLGKKAGLKHIWALRVSGRAGSAGLTPLSGPNPSWSPLLFSSGPITPNVVCLSNPINNKIPVFLLRVETPVGDDYLLASMSEQISGKQRLLSPLETTHRYTYGVTLDTLSSQVISLGHYYKVEFYAITMRRYRTRRESYCKRVAFLRMDSEDTYRDIVSFKGKFYVVDMSGLGHVFVIESSFKNTEISSVTQSHETFDERLVVSEDELFLVQWFTSGRYGAYMVQIV